MNSLSRNIAVVFGGSSMERDVSVASAIQVIRALRSRGHAVTAIDAAGGVISRADEPQILREGVDATPPEQLQALDDRALAQMLSDGVFVDFDVVFLALHGGAGEDGTVQALLDSAGVCYTGSGQHSSALAMSKNLSKQAFRNAAIPTADWVMADTATAADIESLGLPVIVKPDAQGSTVGLTLVQRAADLDAAVELAGQFDCEVMIERYVPGRELTVGVLDSTALAVGEIIPAHGGLFDYAAKYQSGGAEEVFPADVAAEVAERAQAFAKQVSNALGIQCYCRVDFRMDPDGQLWCLEANTLPGLTSGSLLPRSAAASGIEFAALCELICELALQKSGPD